MAFAGHPILGAAFVLGAPLQRGVLDLETGAGIVPVTLERDESGRIRFGRMRQPVPAITLYERAEEVLVALGVARSELPVEHYDNGARHVVVTLDDVGVLARLEPDIAAIAGHDVTGVECIARDGDGWRMRMFWANGEDAATGSAAGPVACHLARHGLVEWGTEVVISQGVEMGRPSRLHAWAVGGGRLVDAVDVGGAAVIVARGEFRV
jgi:trans-2,3-dihydro-3-hydroxyanthranilate isomerase